MRQLLTVLDGKRHVVHDIATRYRIPGRYACSDHLLGTEVEQLTPYTAGPDVQSYSVSCHVRGLMDRACALPGLV